MIIRKINIDTVDKVKTLVKAATQAPFQVEIMTDRFAVNAKSILGLFSLNRTEPVTMYLYTDEGNREYEAFLSELKEYII